MNLILYYESILRKTIEGYNNLGSIPSLSFNTIYTNLNMHAFHCSIYLQSKCVFDLSHASMVKVQYSTDPNGITLYTESPQTLNNV